MSKRYKVVTLCGSTRFKDEFFRVQKELTLKGYIVLSLSIFGHSGDEEAWDEETKKMLIAMHWQKIDMADIVYVINKNGYIGESTEEEIKYAKQLEKTIIYLEGNEHNLLD